VDAGKGLRTLLDVPADHLSVLAGPRRLRSREQRDGLKEVALPLGVIAGEEEVAVRQFEIEGMVVTKAGELEATDVQSGASSRGEYKAPPLPATRATGNKHRATRGRSGLGRGMG
jgi:hypothetical protein